MALSTLLGCLALLGVSAFAPASASAPAVTRHAHATLLAPATGDAPPQIGVVHGLPPAAADTSQTCATASFKDSVNENGWAYLNVTTFRNAACDDWTQAYSAGFLEANLTYVGMFQTIVNGALNTSMPDAVTAFFEDSAKWQAAQLEAAAEGRAPPGAPGGSAYWHQLNLTVAQLQGLVDGFRASAPAEYQMGVTDFSLRLLTQGSDLETLQSFMFPDGGEGADVGFGVGGRCSGLVKLLEDRSDLFTSQVTWSSFNSMLRIYKRYALAATTDGSDSSPTVPSVTFSSYPGALFSGDDFYQVSSGLAVFETTIGNSNASLWKYVRPESVLVWQRYIIANRLATDGESWCQAFAYNQSGTYNNENVVVDYNRFQPGSEPAAGTLFVLDQLPGHVHYDDLTHVLTGQGYLPSYNSPVFRDIFVLGGFAEQQEKYGSWFSYNETARAKIFRRDHSKVTDLESMKSLMRYNDFKHDPLARCDCTPPYSAENAIACRDDLNPATGTYPFGALGHRNHAATDCKIASSELMRMMATAAISSPTYDQQPVFTFSTSSFADIPHLGMPDTWQFPWVTIEW